MSTSVDIKALFEAGVHFGHKTSRWSPKMAPYIHSVRQGTHIIDLEKTVESLNEALAFVEKTSGTGKPILFVGTKKQAKEAVKAAAEKAGQPFVTERWIGGMLTNVTTINQQIKKLKDLERRMQSGDLEKRYNKLEVQRYQEEIDSLNLKYSGIKDMNGRPGAVIVLDTIVDANAVNEAKTLGIPVIGIVDTNADPTKIDYPVPGNDDSIKGLSLILDYFAEATQSAKVKDAPKDTK